LAADEAMDEELTGSKAECGERGIEQCARRGLGGWPHVCGAEARTGSAATQGRTWPRRRQVQCRAEQGKADDEAQAAAVSYLPRSTALTSSAAPPWQGVVAGGEWGKK